MFDEGEDANCSVVPPATRIVAPVKTMPAVSKAERMSATGRGLSFVVRGTRDRVGGDCRCLSKLLDHIGPSLARPARMGPTGVACRRKQVVREFRHALGKGD